jgi:hypothetical protein
MPFRCEILADSIGPHGYRLTTYEIEFPRMVLADMTRHRSLSYSFESTRARPTEVLIEQVREEPYVPTFMRRAKGMGGGERLSPDEQKDAQRLWRIAARKAADMAEQLLWVGKEHNGRMLEPFAWITGIVSGTEWENYFALRCPPEGHLPDPHYPAQMELQIIAEKQRALYRSQKPNQLAYGDWHRSLASRQGERRTHRHGELQEASQQRLGRRGVRALGNQACPARALVPWRAPGQGRAFERSAYRHGQLHRLQAATEALLRGGCS